MQITFLVVFVVVLALIGLVAWLVRRFAGNRLGANTNRGRMPRLAVIDAAAVDGRRRLVLVRRDNIEHLLMIGGPTDIVVEPNIVRATRETMGQRPAAGEPPPRIAPLPDSWNDGESLRPEALEVPEPSLPEPPPRPARPSFTEELRRPAGPLPERRPERAERNDRADPLAGFSPEPLAPRAEPRPELRSEPTMPRANTRTEPVLPRPPRASETAKPSAPPVRAPERATAPPPAAAVSADQNLAEMAQRLEAALRRPAGDAPPVAPEPPADRAARTEPVQTPPAPATKSGFENLEDEMASLLGRPKKPS